MGGPVQRILLDAERSGYPRECRMTALLLVGRSLGDLLGRPPSCRAFLRLGVVRPVEPPEHCTSLRWFTVDGSTAAGERAVSSLVLSITP